MRHALSVLLWPASGVLCTLLTQWAGWLPGGTWQTTLLAGGAITVVFCSVDRLVWMFQRQPELVAFVARHQLDHQVYRRQVAWYCFAWGVTGASALTLLIEWGLGWLPVDLFSVLSALPFWLLILAFGKVVLLLWGAVNRREGEKRS